MRICTARRLSVVLAFATFLFVRPAFSEKVMAPMRDGVKLATDVFLPAGSGPFPALLMRSVYGRGQGPKIAEDVNGRGMALVVQDTRGRGESEGKDMVFADDGWGVNQDGADTVAWILAQPWCNGKVGTCGGSALGITQVLLGGAAEKVSAQSIIVAASNFYGQLSFQGGVWRKSLIEGWTAAQKNGYIVDVWKSHPTYDAFWALYNAEVRAPRTTSPGLHVGGWWDIFGQGTINGFVTRQHQGGEGARGNQKLIMGPWVHGVAKKVGDVELPENFKFDFGAYEKRFFAHWLLGTDDGIMKEPAVNYYTVGDVTKPGGPGNEWRTANDWPPFPTVETAYYLYPDGRLDAGTAPAEAQTLTYTYDPADPCPTHGGQELLLPAGPFDQRTVSGRPDVLKFSTGVLDAPLEITGAVEVRLFVSTDAADTDFTAKLVDIYPDGREILMLDNIQRLKLRNGFTKADPLPAGEVGELVVDLWSISLIFDVGHRIGLQVSSSNYPRFEKNPNSGDDYPTESNLKPAKNSVHMGGKYLSALLLPVRPADGAPGPKS